MSMNSAVCQWRFPMQDEHERGKNEVGVARPGASAYVECREPKPGADSGVSRVERADRVCGVWAEREIRVGGTRVGGAEVRRVGQGGARRSARLCGKGDRHE